MDWGQGRYESTAAQLEPAARAVLAAAAIQPGEAVVDVGCGTGNAALLAAAAGAKVWGIDPAQRLLQVARERAAAAALQATFLEGEAASMTIADRQADAVLSVFGVIFAPDPAAAAAELTRICRPGGRIALSAWIPAGPISEVMRIGRNALAEEGPASGAVPFAWHEREALEGLFAPHGFAVAAFHKHAIQFTAASAEAYVKEQFAEHPMWQDARSVLESRGVLASVRSAALAVFERANEEPGAFRISSRFVVAIIGS